MELHGKNFIGGELSADGAETFSASEAESGRELGPKFHAATESEVHRAFERASDAFQSYRSEQPETMAAFLERIGEELLALGDALIQRARVETALPEARLTGERTRTVNQLRMFAELVREGSWVEACIDRAQPERRPAPKPDLRRMLIPLGPVVVFGASNFPLAFSVAGGDTASALAAGNPVIFKAHPGHPGTSELVAGAITRAVGALGLPGGVFSLLQGPSHELGKWLVEHPAARAVAFTGSQKAGRALFDLAARRPEPIPVYAEMGSTNPVFVLPGALQGRTAALAEALVQSVTLGVGQFCTNPGLVFGLAGPELDALSLALGKLASAVPPGTMLYAGLCERFGEMLTVAERLSGVRVLGKSAATAGAGRAPAVVLGTDAHGFRKHEVLREEMFGPSTLVVSCGSAEEMENIARALPGQLTASIHGTTQELARRQTLVRILEQKVGRLLFNGLPTGVEVCPAMHHGGPYPATTDAHFTSVGTAAMKRFARPLCYQNFPEGALPLELRAQNTRQLWRLVDGQLTRSDG